MNNLLWKAIHHFAGSGNPGPRPSGNDFDAGDLPTSVRVSLNPSKRSRKDLARRGYASARCFLALPSLTSPRWLFPLEDGRSRQAGLEIYKPYARGARILKGLLTAVVGARCQGLALPRLLVASRSVLPLEDLVREVTGECQPVFALSLSTETRFQKLTVQVMRTGGTILGYIKLPLTNAAAGRVRDEAEILNRLGGFPALRSHIPQVLYSGDWGDGTILFQTGGPSRSGPVHLDHLCGDFLQLLWGIHPTMQSGHALWEKVAIRWREAEPGLDSRWRGLGEAALAAARWEVEGAMIPCGVVHGDFAPWNTRAGDQGLYVFDWEYASWEAPILWDIFHFRTQVASLLGKKDDPYVSYDRFSGERASFLLYLLSSTCRLLDEESSTRNAGLEYRRKLLEKQLGGH